MREPLEPLPTEPTPGEYMNTVGRVVSVTGIARHAFLPYLLVRGMRQHPTLVVYVDRDGHRWVAGVGDFLATFSKIPGTWKVSDDGMKILFESLDEREARKRFDKECRKFKTPGKRVLSRPDGKVELVSAGDGR